MIEHSPDSGWPPGTSPLPHLSLASFTHLVMKRGLELYRDLPWRHIDDPYAIWISEVMLQQTQVSRVDGRWQHWLSRFPTVEALADAPQADVLEEWQGMGYNRRALALANAARIIVSEGKGFPQDEKRLKALPGIGPATAAGIRAFAFNLPGMYLETNVRTVFLHELFPDEEGVPDRRLVPLVSASCPQDTPRDWYYALLDYGAWLKRSYPNPSRRSATHVRQSSFEGSHRQKRAIAIRALLDSRDRGLTPDELSLSLSASEVRAGRTEVSIDDARLLLEELAREGFCHEHDGHWYA